MKTSIKDLINCAYAGKKPFARGAVRLASEPGHVYYRDDLEIDLADATHYAAIKERADKLTHEKKGDK